jgi:hypothetical protein
MHSGVQQLYSGKCPKCGMDLILEGTRFAVLRPIGEQPVAPRHDGRRHGRDHGSGDDYDAVTAFKRCETFRTVDEGHC